MTDRCAGTDAMYKYLSITLVALMPILGTAAETEMTAPHELVKAAGVDPASPAPYQAVVARMNQIMDQIGAIQARRK